MPPSSLRFHLHIPSLLSLSAAAAKRDVLLHRRRISRVLYHYCLDVYNQICCDAEFRVTVDTFWMSFIGYEHPQDELQYCIGAIYSADSLVNSICISFLTHAVVPSDVDNDLGDLLREIIETCHYSCNKDLIVLKSALSNLSRRLLTVCGRSVNSHVMSWGLTACPSFVKDHLISLGMISHDHHYDMI